MVQHSITVSLLRVRDLNDAEPLIVRLPESLQGACTLGSAQWEQQFSGRGSARF